MMGEWNVMQHDVYNAPSFEGGMLNAVVVLCLLKHNTSGTVCKYLAVMHPGTSFCCVRAAVLANKLLSQNGLPMPPMQPDIPYPCIVAHRNRHAYAP